MQDIHVPTESRVDSRVAARVKGQWLGIPDRPELIRRVVVLLPNEDFNEAALAQRVWVLASGACAEVLIVAQITDWADEPQIRLRLALLSAILRESGLGVITQLESDLDWVRVVRKLHRPGDGVVCHAEQVLPDRLDTKSMRVALKPLSSFLIALHIPVCELQGIVRLPAKPSVARVIRTWVIPLLIVGLSFFLQIQFMQWARDWAAWTRQLALAAYAIAEIVSIAWLARS